MNPTLGLRGRSLDLWMGDVSRALEVTFEGRYSDDRGGGYWSFLEGEHRVVRLMRNFLEDDGDLLLVGRPEITVVVETYGLEEAELRALLELGAEVLEDQLESWDGGA